MPNLTPSKTKLETSILTTLNKSEQKLLSLTYSGNVQFGQMTNEDKQGLAKCLVKMCYFVGIKEPLSIDNLKMLVYFLVSQHATFTQDELEQAFFMAASGEFGELEHYQSFSPTYVSKIINSYTARRADAMTKYRTKLEDAESEQKRTEKEKEYDALNGCIEVVCCQYDAYLNYEAIMSNEDKIPFQEARAAIAIKMGQKLGLFKDYRAKETALMFFKRVFDVLPKKEPNEVKFMISNWIKKKVNISE